MTNLLNHSRRPDVVLYADGLIRIAARVARLLNLQPGDAINVALHQGELLLFASHQAQPQHAPQCPQPRFHATLYPTKMRSRNLAANSVALVRALLDAAGMPAAKRAAFPCGDPVALNSATYLPIITRLPL